MGLLDDLKDPSLREVINRGAICTVCTMMDALPLEERQALKEMFVDEKVASTNLERVLRKNGHQVRAYSINRHRRGECRGARG